jgi:hypothetical protein
VQPHGYIANMFVTGAPVTVGDVVVTQTATMAYNPASTSTATNPLCNVVPADGNAAPPASGYLGVVVGLGSTNGAIGDTVRVQFGGVVQAKVLITTSAIVTGDPLAVSDNTGLLGNGAASTSTAVAAISLQGASPSGAAQTIWVMLTNNIWSPTAV